MFPADSLTVVASDASPRLPLLWVLPLLMLPAADFVCRMDDASISWREPVVAPGGAPPPDIPGRKKDRKAASEWRDLVLDLGTSEQLLDRVPDERRPK